MNTNIPVLLTIEQFMKTYGIGRTKTYQQINEGRLAAKKIGRRTFIPTVAANQWLMELPDYQ